MVAIKSIINQCIEGKTVSTKHLVLPEGKVNSLLLGRAMQPEASVFYFEKKVAEKLHKPKRKETITEILRFSVRQLDRLKHPKLLTLYHPIEESNDALAFATEPVLGTLANVLGCLEERLPQNLPPLVREYSFLDLEIKYGVLQLTEALCFLHYSCKLIHRNLCPQSVIINKRGTWKLAGLEFAEKCNENDIMVNIFFPFNCVGLEV
ncbi:SCY1-like protein 2 [Trichonephila clavata]|uniref:SCY1-like protein 2 n=1 Tax=Trichonephila clavata TaxID=2740835 RepID=A0A8X6M0E0_TRICU|nr:SCY1-like protein 2 [Trichonephila clavata]